MSSAKSAGLSTDQARANYFALKDAGFKPGRWHASPARTNYLFRVAEARDERIAQKESGDGFEIPEFGFVSPSIVFDDPSDYERYFDDWYLDYEDEEWVSSMDYSGRK